MNLSMVVAILTKLSILTFISYALLKEMPKHPRTIPNIGISVVLVVIGIFQVIGLIKVLLGKQ